MRDKKKSARGGSLISRRRMLHYGLAGMVGMAGMAGGFPPVSAFGETTGMSGTKTEGRPIFTISKPTGAICFTHETLALIRQSLLEALQRQAPGDAYAHLISEIETGNAAPMIFADSAYIGRWKLVCHNDALMLETQQIQANAQIRLVYTAPLEWQDGQWNVLAVFIKTVKAAGNL